MSRRCNLPSPSSRTMSRTLVVAGMAMMTVAGASHAAAAHEPPDDRSMAIGSRATQPIEMTWVSSGVVAAANQVTARVADSPTSDDLAVAAEPADNSSSPIPLDDLISNYGCMMVEAEPGEHLGVNCIDDGWLNLDGTVYVHTTVPAGQHVRVSSSPPASVGDDEPPHFATFDADSAPNYESYEFTSKPFDIVPAETYHILAMAWDSEGNMAWRYGTATVPYVAQVLIDEITVLNDGDEGSLNRGEIEFRLGVGDEQWTFGEEKYDDGDSFNPDVDHVISDAGPTLRIYASATEDDPGKCVIESSGDAYQDGGGCHFASAGEEFDLTTGQPTLIVNFSSPHEHLRFRVEGHITVSLP